MSKQVVTKESIYKELGKVAMRTPVMKHHDNLILDKGAPFGAVVTDDMYVHCDYTNTGGDRKPAALRSGQVVILEADKDDCVTVYAYGVVGSYVLSKEAYEKYVVIATDKEGQ